MKNYYLQEIFFHSHPRLEGYSISQDLPAVHNNILCFSGIAFNIVAIGFNYSQKLRVISPVLPSYYSSVNKIQFV